MKKIWKDSEKPWNEISTQIRRKVLGTTQSLTAVKVLFDLNGQGDYHVHQDHDQFGFIAEGAFEVTIDGKTSILKKGDWFLAPKGTAHGAKAIEQDSVIIDMFSPERADLRLG